MIETREVEGGRYVIPKIGTTICPSPQLCDIRSTMGEGYHAYVLRHLTDHGVAHIDSGTGTSALSFEDQERNLAMRCFFYYAKHIQGNRSLGTVCNGEIIADYEPCWEDAEFLANDTFHPDDLEQDTPWDERTFHLKPASERRTDGVRKLKKKLTKVRGTQKTSWAKAFITWKHLRAYFLFGRRNYRVLCVSAVKGTARDNHFEPIKTIWESHATLTRLFGKKEYTARYATLMRRRAQGKMVSDEELEGETRYLCLLARGSRATPDRMRLRWNIQDEHQSGKTAVSLRCAGIATSKAGGRWDLIVIDDPVDEKNWRTASQRQKVKDNIADLRKQAVGDAEILYLNTPRQIDDASSQIDREQAAQYHILYRPAMWYDNHTKEPHYYWQRSAPCVDYPDGEELWTPKRIADERSLPDFWSQIMLRLRNESEALFREDDFQLIEPDRAPLEVRAGLGGVRIGEREAEHMQRESLRVRGMTFLDTADDQERAVGDDSAEVSIRFDRWGNIYITRASAGRWNTEQEMEQTFDAWQYNDSELIEIEAIGSQKKWARSSYADFQRRKAVQLNRSITMPIHWAEGGVSMGKEERIDRMFSFTSTGRVFVLTTIPKEMRERLIRQFCYRGEEPHNDLADALSRVVPYAARVPREEKPVEKAVAPREPIPSGVVRVKVKDLVAALDAGERFAANWGARRSA